MQVDSSVLTIPTVEALANDYNNTIAQLRNEIKLRDDALAGVNKQVKDLTAENERLRKLLAGETAEDEPDKDKEVKKEAIEV